MVSTGQKAPDFIAPAVQDGEGTMVELFAEIQAHDAVVLVFAPAAFVPSCTAEFCAVRDARWHEQSGLATFGLSGDSLFSHAAYANQYDVPFPLVSDFHGGIADSYGLLADDWEGHSSIPMRATVVIDGDWSVLAVETVDEPLDEVSPAPVERAAETLQENGFDVVRPTVDYHGPW